MQGLPLQRTLDLLNELQGLGFSDEAFAELHHFQLSGKNASIEAHRAYLQKAAKEKGQKRVVRTNQKVQQRLALVLAGYESDLFKEPVHDLFIGLARAAWVQIPHKGRRVKRKKTSTK